MKHFIYLHRYSLFACLVLLFCGVGIYQNQTSLHSFETISEGGSLTIVLDPGHGGADPGKIGANQTLEKDINLAIALKCKKKLEEKHIQVMLTRQTDTMLANDSDDHSKAADMRMRRKQIEESNAALAVSIHQNSYPSESVFGAQVFYYSTSSEGKRLAEQLQNSLLNCNTQNKRKAKANDSYYILKSGSCPVVICECGFLSNQQECQLLSSDSYQEQIANAISKGILQYLQQTALQNQ